jgi:hypothetical protein
MFMAGYRSRLDFLKDSLRWATPLLHAKRRLFPNPDGLAGFTKVPVLRSFPTYIPYSAGTYADRAPITIQAINAVFPAIASLASSVGREKAVEDIRSVADTKKKLQTSAALGELFDKYGSDKTRHDYHFLYGSVLGKDAARVLEIGIGTNNTDVLSNMGYLGKPGASLRAFRDFCPAASVHGADIDRRIFFSEDRIETHYIDQTDPASLADLQTELTGNFDLVIDDGLHSPHANVHSLEFGLKLVRPGGWVVIEDIGPPALPIWKSIAAILPESYSSRLLRAPQSFVFAVRKPV